MTKRKPKTPTRPSTAVSPPLGYEAARAPASSGKEKKRSRTERHVPTELNRGKVQALKAFGHKDIEICWMLGISSTSTLYRHYSEDLKIARPTRIARWETELENLGLDRKVDPNTGRVVSAGVKHRDRAGILMFLLQCMAGWRRSDRMELANPDGTPIAPAGPGGFAVVALMPSNGRVGPPPPHAVKANGSQQPKPQAPQKRG